MTDRDRGAGRHAVPAAPLARAAGEPGRRALGLGRRPFVWTLLGSALGTAIGCAGRPGPDPFDEMRQDFVAGRFSSVDGWFLSQHEIDALGRQPGPTPDGDS